MMTVVYAQQPLPRECSASIFLAGPTPRGQETPSWRPEAIARLREQGFEGHVFVPEPADGRFGGSYDAQVEWETLCLERADCVLFWLPRELGPMPGFTTNDEWGALKNSGRVVFGAPDSAEKVRYQHWWAERLYVRTSKTLAETVDAALAFLGPTTNDDRRVGGECQVPRLVWRRPEFQRWYARQRAAGHRLDRARLLWTYRGGREKQFLVFWTLAVEVYVSSEARSKRNEVLFGRSDVSATVLYRRGATLRDTEVVLVREYRSAGSAPDGFVHELPAGSSFYGADPRTTAAEEVIEETGLSVVASALCDHGARPIAATFSVHHGHMFSLALSDEQMEGLRASVHVPHGLLEHSEQTWVEIRSVGDLLDRRDVDWSTLGMVLSALA